MSITLLRYAAFQRHSTAFCLKKYLSVTSRRQALNGQENLGRPADEASTVTCRRAAPRFTDRTLSNLVTVSSFNGTRHRNTMSLDSNLATQVESTPFASSTLRILPPPPACTSGEGGLVRDGVSHTWQDALREPGQCPHGPTRFLHPQAWPCKRPLLCTGSVALGYGCPFGGYAAGGTPVRCRRALCYQHCREPRIYPFVPPQHSLTFRSLSLGPASGVFLMLRVTETLYSEKPRPLPVTPATMGSACSLSPAGAKSPVSSRCAQ